MKLELPLWILPKLKGYKIMTIFYANKFNNLDKIEKLFEK